MDALLVVDVQEDYIGEGRNDRRFFYHSGRYTPQLAKGLDVVSGNIFVNQHANCFSNTELARFLRDNNVTGLELVGIDGNYCVAASARAGKRNGFSVLLDQKCVEAAKAGRFTRTVDGLRHAGITVVR